MSSVDHGDVVGVPGDGAAFWNIPGNGGHVGFVPASGVFGMGSNDGSFVKKSNIPVLVGFRVNNPKDSKEIAALALKLFNRIRSLPKLNQDVTKVLNFEGNDVDTQGFPKGDEMYKFFDMKDRFNRRFKTNIEFHLTLVLSTTRLWDVKGPLMQFLKASGISINERLGTTAETMVQLGFVMKGDGRFNLRWLTETCNKRMSELLQSDNTLCVKYDVTGNHVCDLVFHKDKTSSVFGDGRYQLKNAMSVSCPLKFSDLYSDVIASGKLFDATVLGPLAKEWQFISYGWKKFPESQQSFAKSVQATINVQESLVNVSVVGIHKDEMLPHRDAILKVCPQIMYLEPGWSINTHGRWLFYCDKDDVDLVTHFVDEELKNRLEDLLGHRLSPVRGNTFERLETRRFDQEMFNNVFKGLDTVDLPVNDNNRVTRPAGYNAWQSGTLNFPSLSSTQGKEMLEQTKKELINVTAPAVSDMEKKLKEIQEANRKQIEANEKQQADLKKRTELVNELSLATQTALDGLANHVRTSNDTLQGNIENLRKDVTKDIEQLTQQMKGMNDTINQRFDQLMQIILQLQGGMSAASQNSSRFGQSAEIQTQGSARKRDSDERGKTSNTPVGKGSDEKSKRTRENDGLDTSTNNLINRFNDAGTIQSTTTAALAIKHGTDNQWDFPGDMEMEVELNGKTGSANSAAGQQ